MKNLMTDELAANYNMKGRGTKHAFEGCRNILNLIFCKFFFFLLLFFFFKLLFKMLYFQYLQLQCIEQNIMLQESDKISQWSDRQISAIVMTSEMKIFHVSPNCFLILSKLSSFWNLISSTQSLKFKNFLIHFFEIFLQYLLFWSTSTWLINHFLPPPPLPHIYYIFSQISGWIITLKRCIWILIIYI